MKEINKQTVSRGALAGKQRSYNEVVEWLDANWKAGAKDKSLSRMKQLDKAFGTVSKKLKTILVAGTNGKSLTINFTAQLLEHEGLKVGTFYSPHILSYNERFTINSETISNKAFADFANEVLNTAEREGLAVHSLEVLTMMALLFFDQNNVDATIMEVSENGSKNPVNVCSALIAAITRVTEDSSERTKEALIEMLGIANKGTHVVSADQNKQNLNRMLEISEEKGSVWAMPIRKLAQLRYPFEQLHGRSAALAERIAYLFINDVLGGEGMDKAQSLLTKQKGQRGRPTLEAKRQSELNPRKTVDQFWKETVSTLGGRFQLLEKEKPSLLLDSASNLDAFENLLLGIRLLHYQRPLKGLTLIIGNNNPLLDMPEFTRLLRYFFKKTSGQVIVCPVTSIPGDKGDTSWYVDKTTNDIKSMKVKAQSSNSFKEAFELAQESVDEKHGLVVIAGCASIINEFWKYKGIKKI